MTGSCSCGTCVLALLMTTWLTTTTTCVRLSAQLDLCLPQNLTNDFTEWNSEQYRQRGCVVINWNVPPQTDATSCCSSRSNSSCFESMTNASVHRSTVRQLTPIHIPPLTSICLQTVETNTSNTSTSAAAAGGDDVAYHVTESEFISCRLNGSLVSSPVPAVTAYHRLQSASNYFIASSVNQCREGLRINVTVTSFTCAESPASMTPCSARGRCISHLSDVESGYTCVCCDGFTGHTFSDQLSNVTTERTDCGKQCSSRETEVSRWSDGHNSSSRVELDVSCSSNYTSECIHGICVSGRCYCRPGYGGVHCQLRYSSSVPRCQSSPCRNGGLCLPSNSSSSNVTCVCQTGYTGYDCSIKVDLCLSNPCEHACVDHGQYYVCECRSGYTGENCEQKLDACHPSPCHHRAVCQLSTQHVTGYTCRCTPGYHGNHCQYYSELELMLMEDGSGLARLRSVRTVLYMLVMSLVAVTAVIVYSYCRVQQVCARVNSQLRLQTKRRRHRNPLSYRYSAHFGSQQDLTSLLPSSSSSVDP